MTFRDFWQTLTSIYPENEARWIGRFVFEVKYGLSHADLLMGKETSIDESWLQELQRRLLTGEPVQYVIGKAPFGDHLFQVTPAVLIPRPETLWLCNAVSTMVHSCDVLDIGTGSGCIAITIAMATSLSATDSHGLIRTNSSELRVSPCKSVANNKSVAKITA